MPTGVWPIHAANPTTPKGSKTRTWTHKPVHMLMMDDLSFCCWSKAWTVHVYLHSRCLFCYSPHWSCVCPHRCPNESPRIPIFPWGQGGKLRLLVYCTCLNFIASAQPGKRGDSENKPTRQGHSTTPLCQAAVGCDWRLSFEASRSSLLRKTAAWMYSCGRFWVPRVFWSRTLHKPEDVPHSSCTLKRPSYIPICMPYWKALSLSISPAIFSAFTTSRPTSLPILKCRNTKSFWQQTMW